MTSVVDKENLVRKIIIFIDLGVVKSTMHVTHSIIFPPHFDSKKANDVGGTSTSFTSTSTTGGGSSFTGLVADSKKFNAARIRRRMMEQKQQQKQQGSKGGAIAVRKPLGTTQKQPPPPPPPRKNGNVHTIPPKDELAAPTTSEPAPPAVNAKKRNLPNLAIAVSMSEDADENSGRNDATENLYRNLPGMAGMDGSDDDDTNAGNVSAWAMIEHYGHVGFDSPSGSAKRTNERQRNNDDDADDAEAEDKLTPLRKQDSPSTIFHTAVGYDDDDSTANSSSQGLSTTAISNDIFAGSPTASKGNESLSPSQQFEWYTDDNGELAQKSVCNESSFMNSPQFQHSSAVDTNQVPAGETRPSGPAPWDYEKYVDEDEKKELDEDDDVVSSSPTSLLQESAILSELGQSTAGDLMESSILGKAPDQSIDESQNGRPQEVPEQEHPVAEDSYVEHGSVGEESSYGSRTDTDARISLNQTQLSVASFEKSEVGNLSSVHEEQLGVSISPQKRRNPQQDLAIKNSHQLDKDGIAAHARIEELEQNLKEQEFKAGSNESKLQDRVRALEHALRASVTTPKGSVMQEDPLKALLDRNHSLVKEVRFADQTCIELSSKISAMAAKNQILSDQNSDLHLENERLTKELASCRKSHVLELDEKQQVIDELMEHTMANLGSSNSEAEDGPGSEAAESELHHTRKELADANIRLVDMEENRKHEANEYAEKIRNLEEQLRQATDHMYLYQDGPTSPRLKDADRRVFDLEKELAHSKASVEALRNQISQSRSSLQVQGEEGGDLSLDESKEVIVMVQKSLSRILSRYKSMEGKVNDTIDQYSKRIENLTTAVACLRSSLEFETDSVSSQPQEKSNKNAMEAVIDQSQNLHTEDQMLQYMEEARSPLPQSKSAETEENSTDDDISRLFSDDVTLESMSKIEQSFGSPLTFSQDRYKEPLEIAIRECKRVKDIAIKLRTEVESRKEEIEKLEIENGKLSLYASRQSEETRHVEKALEEARCQLRELEEQLESSENDNADLQKQLEELTAKAAVLQKERDSKEAQVQVSAQNLKERDQQIEYFKKELYSTRDKMHEAIESVELHKSRHQQTLLEKDAIEKQITTQKNEEIRAVEVCLEDSRREVETLKSSQEETMARLIAESQEKVEYQSQVQKLEATQQQILSDAEDRLLEERFKQEDSRIEKADLKSRLTRKEKEFNSLHESYKTLQKRAEHEIQRRDTSLRTLKAQLAEFVLYSKDLSEVRINFCELMKSHGLADDWVRTLSSLSFLETSTAGETSGGANEVGLWAGVVPNIATTIQKLLGSADNAEQLQRTVDMLNENIIQLHAAEEEYKERLKEGHDQNEKLYSLLHQAEQEMERSASQIRELSAALSRLQQQEAAAIEKAESAESRLDEVNAQFSNELGEIRAEKDEALSKISELASTLKERETSIFDLENDL